MADDKKTRKKPSRQGTRLSPRPAWSVLLLALAGTTVLVSGGCTMVVELVAGRLVSRFLGSSLYTWTAIIGIVLAGLSIGNCVGGRLADRRRPEALLALLFALCAAGCVAVLPLNAWAGGWAAFQVLPWPARIFCHVGFVFLLPSIFLGTISPVVAKVALGLGSSTGRTMGIMYACGAGGAVAGTFLAGFWLIAVMAASTIIYVVAGMLALFAVGYGVRAFTGRSTDPGRVKPAADTPASTGPSGDRGAAREWVGFCGAVFIAGLCVMVLEMTAGRIVSKHIGQSLYSWTSVIGVVLGGIVVGNYVGGRLADWFRPSGTLAVLWTLSSAACVLTLVADDWLAGGFRLLITVRTEIVLHAVFTSLAPSLLLGAIPPVVAKSALGQGRYGAGRTVGYLYAWNTVGSIVGVFFAGYWLIGLLGTRGVVCALAAVLAITAAVYGRRSRLTAGWATLFLLGAVACWLPWSPATRLARGLHLRATRNPEIIYAEESQYSQVVVRAPTESPGRRSLVLDTLLHSKVNLADPLDLLYSYGQCYAGVVDENYAAGRPINAFFIGGGGYVFPRYIELTRPGSYIEVTEIDPAVTRAAHEAFGLPRDTAIRAFDMDARNRVADIIRRRRDGSGPPLFDCVFGDAVSGYAVPYHLTTIEFIRDISDLMKPDGIYLFNMIDKFPDARFLAAALATCRQVFPHVYVLAPDDNSLSNRSTFVLACSKRPLQMEPLIARLRTQYGFQGRLLADETLAAVAQRNGGVPLTDDYAPVEHLLAGLWRSLPDGADEALGAAIEELRSRGGQDAAIEELRRLTAKHPGWAEAHSLLGDALHGRGRLAEAAEHYRRCLELRPDSALAHFRLGNVLVKLGQPAEAVEVLEQSVSLAPDLAPSHFVLGCVFHALGARDKIPRGEVNPRIEKALAHYRLAARHDPANAHYRDTLTRALAELGRTADSLPEENVAGP